MTPMDSDPAQGGERSPFAGASARPARTIAGRIAALALLAAAVLTVILILRTPAPAPAAAHAAVAGRGSDSGRTVTLSPRDARRIGVTFAEVTRGPLERTIRIVGQVTYDETRVASVTVRVDGFIQRLHADVTGMQVRAGEPLLDLYSPMVVSTERDLLLAKRLAAGLAGGDAEALHRAEDLVEAGRRRLAAWEIPAREVRRLEETGVVAGSIVIDVPMTGTVTEKLALPGQRVMAGDPLYRIVNLGEVWLEGEVFEQDLPAVRLGQTVTAEFQALPGEERTGRVSYISPMLDPETRTARARVVLRNADHKLKPGMFGTIRFAAPARAGALSVPRSAVLATGERNLVFVRRPDGQFTPREVVLGASTDDRVEVLRGLVPGETVVASGTFLLDAESNLGTLLGGMGDMPGMDMTAPGVAPPKPSRVKPADSGMKDMPGMTHPREKE